MFANILLLSLLTIIYGTKGEEGGGGSAVDTNAVNFLPDVSQQRSSDGTDKYLLLSLGDCVTLKRTAHFASRE